MGKVMEELPIKAEELHKLNWRDILAYNQQEIRMISKYELDYVNKHLDFKIKGIPVSKFQWECKPKLFSVGKGYCRITLHQLYRAMNDCSYKRRLERCMKLGNDKI